VAAAACNDYSFNRSLAYQAWLIFAAVDSVLELEKSFFAIGIDVIGNARASKPDGLIQNFLQCAVQTLEFVAIER
jgi:hypothetical protein